jgi:hypothetical protein
MYKANGASLEDAETGAQVLVMIASNCSKKQLREIVKLTANMLNNIERSKEAVKLAEMRRRGEG